MNRFELFLFLLSLMAVTIIVIKSKWFDRMVDSLLRGTKSTSVDDLKADSTRLKTGVQTLDANLTSQAADIERAKTDLKSL